MLIDRVDAIPAVMIIHVSRELAYSFKNLGQNTDLKYPVKNNGDSPNFRAVKLFQVSSLPGSNAQCVFTSHNTPSSFATPKVSFGTTGIKGIMVPTIGIRQNLYLLGEVLPIQELVSVESEL